MMNTVKISILWVVPCVFVMASILYNVIAFASLGPIGGELYAITLKRESLQQKNSEIATALALTQSLQKTQQTAELKGYIPISRITQLEIADTKVALRTTP